MSIIMSLCRRPAVLALLLAVVALACAEAPKPPPEEAYRRAVEEAREGHNQEAKRLFEQVRDADTPVRLEFLAEIGIADSLYKDRKYEEAAAEYAHLFEIHSGDAIADYLKYQLGMCYYRRIDTIDRDQGLTRRARSEFTELVTRYPESDLVAAARENLRLCNEYLAKRELYVGNFYFDKGNYQAAKSRYQAGITSYGRIDSMPQLLHRLALAEDALGETDAAQQAAARLAAEYPDDPWNQNLHAALEKQRQRLAAKAHGDGLLNRVRHWWSEEKPPTPGTPTEMGHEGPAPAASNSAGTVPTAAESEGTAPAAAEPNVAPAKGTEEASPSSQPEGHLVIDAPSSVTVTSLDTGAQAPSAPPRVRRFAAWLQSGGVAEAENLETAGPPAERLVASVASDPENQPWPGSTVATVKAAPSNPSATAASRWERFVTWLHGPAADSAAPPPPSASAAATTTTPGLIVRRIPPVVDEPSEGTPVAREPQPLRPMAASPAPVSPSEPSAEAAPASLNSAAPSPKQVPVAVAAAPSTREVPPPAVAPASTAPAPSSGPVMTDLAAGHGGLVVEEFPAADDGEEPGLPAVQEAPPTPATPEVAASPPSAPVPSAPRPPLAERVEEAIAAAEGGSTPASPSPATARPVPRTTEVEPLAVSGQGTRNQPPRPLPLPAYARATPPPSGKPGLVPAAIAGRQTTATPSVEWRTLTPARRPAPAGEPTGNFAAPAFASPGKAPSEPPAPRDFWQGLRDTYGRLAESEP